MFVSKYCYNLQPTMSLMCLKRQSLPSTELRIVFCVVLPPAYSAHKTDMYVIEIYKKVGEKSYNAADALVTICDASF